MKYMENLGGQDGIRPGSKEALPMSVGKNTPPDKNSRHWNVSFQITKSGA